LFSVAIVHRAHGSLLPRRLATHPPEPEVREMDWRSFRREVTLRVGWSKATGARFGLAPAHVRIRTPEAATTIRPSETVWDDSDVVYRHG
jgi:hypothetical protein